MGYSLVGVYPCAVWQPQNQPQQDPVGPIRNQRDSNIRSAPYPTQTVQIPVQIAVQPQPTKTVVQPAQVVVTTCGCNKSQTNVQNTSSATDSEVSTPNTASPMLFVPFTVPAFAPTMGAAVTTLPNMGTPKVSFYSFILYQFLLAQWVKTRSN